MNILSIDVGNGFTKAAFSPLKIKIFPSHVAEISSPDEACLDFGANGSIISYLDGDREDLIGRCFAVGTAASITAPGAYQEIISEGGNKGKYLWGLLLAINSIRPSYSGEIKGIKILASLPDIEALGDKFRSSFIGHHVIEQNGDRLILNILDVVIKPESAGCLISCLADGVIDRGTSAIIDIGHGTIISSGFSPSGVIIPRLRMVLDHGISDLINSIAGDIELRRMIGGHAKPHLIQRAISSLDFQYGSSGIDISEIFKKRLRLWAEKSIKPAIQNLAPMRDEIDNIILCGGGANLLVNFAQKQKFIIAPDPQNAHIKGLAILAEKLAKSEAANEKKIC